MPDVHKKPVQASGGRTLQGSTRADRSPSRDRSRNRSGSPASVNTVRPELRERPSDVSGGQQKRLFPPPGPTIRARSPASRNNSPSSAMRQSLVNPPLPEEELRKFKSDYLDKHCDERSHLTNFQLDHLRTDWQVLVRRHPGAINTYRRAVERAESGGKDPTNAKHKARMSLESMAGPDHVYFFERASDDFLVRIANPAP
ncbi:MAG: hypothetical protein M1828_002468 [Chrysothrix sp. TS-e1954]|nr:MAG: hypothetical protein M1828_002468 [Chrysothrix sp. TS-e1954]